MKALYALLLNALVFSLVPASAFAAVSLTGVTVDVATVETMVGIVIVGLAAMWGIRKLIKTTNRS